MTVLLMGFRSGAAISLEKKNIPYLIWTEKLLKNPRKCLGLIQGRFPDKKEDLDSYSKELEKVTHVIASTESAVIPAGLIRRELNLYRNSNSVNILCTDKLKMKQYLISKDIPMTDFICSKGQTPDSIVERLGLPVVNKVKLSSGWRGVQIIKVKEDIKNVIDKDSYFEKMIDGVEGSIESFVQDKKIIFTNISQYYKNGFCTLVPGQFSNEIRDEITKLNSNVIKSLNLKWGMTHLEYYITKDGILFGEVALRPPGGYIMEALKNSYGQNFWDLFIDIELIKTDISINSLSRFSSSIIIHPGEGRVKKITGFDIVQALESRVKFKLNVKIGDYIEERSGVGEDCGYLILSNSSQKKLNEDINIFFSQFQITLD